MAWSPTKAIITARAIPENLLTYVTDATRCADALTWAGGSSYAVLKKYTTSALARTTPIYPCIAFEDDQDKQDLSGDLIEAVYSVIFELSIQNASADTATLKARIYAKAVSSMIVNCPTATLITNTGAVFGLVEAIEVGFMPIKTNEKQNDFLQQFQIRTTISLTTGA